MQNAESRLSRFTFAVCRLTIHDKNAYMKNSPNIYKILFTLGIATVMATCTPDKEGLSLGSKPTADFTATPLPGNPNRIVITDNSKGDFMHSFDYGNGNFNQKHRYRFI